LDRSDGNPIVPVVFSLTVVHDNPFELAGLKLERISSIITNTAKFDLLLVMADAGNLRGQWEYRTDLFDSETISRLSKHFVQLVDSILDDPWSPISSLQILSKDEIQVLEHPAERDLAAADFHF
jgi:non-ribosomal peptide synthetase component F